MNRCRFALFAIFRGRCAVGLRALVGLTLLLGAGTLPAAESPTREPYEMSLVGGFRSGGEFRDGGTGEILNLDEGASNGVVFRIPDSTNAYIELYYSTQQTRTEADGSVTGDPFFDMEVSYFHVGGMREFGESRHRPYLLATIGLARFDPEGGSLDAETRLSLGIGGGYRFSLTRHTRLRLEARALGTAFDTGGALFCANGRCSIEVSGRAFWQTELSVSVGVAF